MNAGDYVGGEFLGAALDWSLALHVQGDLALSASGFLVFAHGLLFDVLVHAPHPLDAHAVYPGPFTRSIDERVKGEGLRVGLRGAEQVTWSDAANSRGHEVRMVGGGGKDHLWRFTYWCTPLPPPTQVMLVCRWPARGIDRVERTVDGKAIVEASRRAVRFWPDDEDGGEA